MPAASFISTPGFTNTDGVSCYANSVIQVIFHCRSILLNILDETQETPLKQLARAFISQSGNLECKDLRTYLGEPFSLRQQQDVSEFFNAITARFERVIYFLIN